MKYYIRLHGVFVKSVGFGPIPPDDAIEVDGPVEAPYGTRYIDGQIIPPATPRPSLNHLMGEDGQWLLNEDMAWGEVRGKRDQLLKGCDWVTIKAQERGEAVPAEWLAYRQALRDITNQSLPVEWPVRPQS